MVHYPTPVHLQTAFAYLGHAAGALPRSENHCRRILSLPVFPELEKNEVLAVCARINAFQQT
jgi:dTDP-4-amino-4,6-dideoxygalactose transaminase